MNPGLIPLPIRYIPDCCMIFGRWQNEERECPGCYGSGVQRNKKTGLNVLCPICLGSGKIRISRDIMHRRALRV